MSQNRIEPCFVEFGLLVVSIIFLINTLASLNQKGTSLLPPMPMMLLTDNFASGLLHVLTLPSRSDKHFYNFRDRAADPRKRPLKYMYDVEKIRSEDRNAVGLLSRETF